MPEPSPSPSASPPYLYYGVEAGLGSNASSFSLQSEDPVILEKDEEYEFTESDSEPEAQGNPSDEPQDGAENPEESNQGERHRERPASGVAILGGSADIPNLGGSAANQAQFEVPISQ